MAFPDTCFAVQITAASPAEADDATVGLIDSNFRWVTGRPGFTAGTPPSGEKPGDVWYEGILNQPEDFGPAVRMIDITTAGGYGTLQGIKFSIDNTAQYGGITFSDYLETNDIFLANRTVKVYAVIAGVFTQLWAGVVSDMSWDELSFTFACESDYKRIHKNLPARTIDAQSFGRADNKVIGTPIPVCFGYVQHARLLNLDGRPDAINLSGTTDLRVSAATQYVNVSGAFYLRMKTPSASFAVNAFAGKMLHCIKGSEQSVYILSSLATGGSGSTAYTDLYLDMPLSGTFVAYTSPPTDTTWWFEVIENGSTYAPSDIALTKIFERDGITKRKVVEYYESDAGEYNNIWELVRDDVLNADYRYKTPYITLMSNSRDLIRGGGAGFISGEGATDAKGNIRFAPQFTYTGATMVSIPIVPVAIGSSARAWQVLRYMYGGDQIAVPLVSAGLSVPSDFTSKVIDRSRATSSIIASTFPSTDHIHYFDVQFPKDKLSGSLDELYLLFDADVTCTAFLTVKVYVYKLDPFGVVYGSKILDFTYGTGPGTTEMNFLPDDYYAGGGDLNGETSLAQTTSTSYRPVIEEMKLAVASVSDISDVSGGARFRLEVRYQNVLPQSVSVAYKQIGFVAKTAAAFRSWDIYAAVLSSIGANVYNAFYSILQTYDGIAAGNIDYTGITDKRAAGWPVGRQVMDRKNSVDYITELARQSFVGVFPTRTGKLGLKAFREFSTAVKAFGPSNIIAGTISKFEKTPNDDVYNEFDIQYAWDDGRKKFMRSLGIANVDDPGGTGFPTELASTGTDTNVVYDTMTITQMTGSDTWVAAIAISAGDPTWAVEGVFVSFSPGQAWADFKYARVNKKLGSGPWAVWLDLDGFPGAQGSGFTTGIITAHSTGVRKWTTYTPGISDYQLGKDMWTVCHNSYLHTLTKRKAPDELSKCYWYPDCDAFAEIAGNNAALEYLKELVSWSTRQKDVAQFAAPLRDSMTLELLDFCTFTDAKFTNGDTRQGYITMIKHDVASCQTVIEVILEPADIETVGGIIETGSAPDTITETGSATDTITEGV